MITETIRQRRFVFLQSEDISNGFYNIDLIKRVNIGVENANPQRQEHWYIYVEFTDGKIANCYESKTKEEVLEKLVETFKGLI